MVDFYIKNQLIEKAIAEECDLWAQVNPLDFEVFKTHMDHARQDMREGTIGRLEMEIPEELHKAIGERLPKNGRPNRQWTSDPQIISAFKKVFLVGMLRPVDAKRQSSVVVPEAII